MRHPDIHASPLSGVQEDSRPDRCTAHLFNTFRPGSVCRWSNAAALQPCSFSQPRARRAHVGMLPLLG